MMERRFNTLIAVRRDQIVKHRKVKVIALASELQQVTIEEVKWLREYVSFSSWMWKMPNWMIIPLT